MPQVYSNYKRKSTLGWNIHNILLDFTGGTFSFGQNLVDTIRDSYVITPDGQSASLNIAKFALSIVSILFDIIFVIQHYCLYKGKSPKTRGYNAHLVNDIEGSYRVSN
jgi:cystinosin